MSSKAGFGGIIPLRRAGQKMSRVVSLHLKHVKKDASSILLLDLPGEFHA
ncbi:MAG TPA: hypothetical protein VLZ56_07355 [Mycoplana sp.]|nr:hypothetical protein [Mycoplana sp.]